VGCYSTTGGKKNSSSDMVTQPGRSLKFTSDGGQKSEVNAYKKDPSLARKVVSMTKGDWEGLRETTDYTKWARSKVGKRTRGAGKTVVYVGRERLSHWKTVRGISG